MATSIRYHSDLAIPPGEYLEEVLESLGMSKDELAKRMGRPAAKLSAIFKGEKAITSETALQLERAVGVPAHIWQGLESEYRLTLAREDERQHENEMTQETDLVAEFCYRELVKEGAVEKRTRPTEKVHELQKFFGVNSLRSVLQLRRYQAAFRCGKSRSGQRKPEAVAAWLRLGEKRAQDITCPPYDRGRLEGILPRLRAMTLESTVCFERALLPTLAECGVVLVLCPHFPKTKAHGATFWLGRQKAVLMLTSRGKWADIFWFSLFHEIGHILLHKRADVFLEDEATSEREKEADRFAADVLIPPDSWRRFRTAGTTNRNAIEVFAHELNIHPGIVVGRLHHEKLLAHDRLNQLRQRFEPARIQVGAGLP